MLYGQRRGTIQHAVPGACMADVAHFLSINPLSGGGGANARVLSTPCAVNTQSVDYWKNFNANNT